MNRLFIGSLCALLISIFALNLFSSTITTTNLPKKVANISDPTTYDCSKPFSPDKPLIQYLIVFDAGSTGSRIHIYKFNFCNQMAALEGEIFEVTKPGLSSYWMDAEKAADSLQPLIDIALKETPKDYHSKTPLVLKATAGLRLKGEKICNETLGAVRNRLSSLPFPLSLNEPVALLKGSDEALYAWVTVNFLLNNFGTSSSPSNTRAILDLGGGSSQIAYFTPQEVNRTSLVLDGVEYLIYQRSDLGFGLNEFRKRVHKQISKEDGRQHPCVGSGLEVLWRNEEDEEVVLKGRPSFKSCEKTVKEIIQKNISPMIVPGPKEELYAFSYYVDVLVPLLNGSLRTSLPVIKRIAASVCDRDNENYDRWILSKEGWTSIDENPADACLDLTYLYSLLTTGYLVSNDTEIILAKKIDGVETGWSLGLSFSILQEKDWWKNSQ